ncbi:lytic transglycosylase domain-containing protein [Spirochaeta lutea]|uniref:lytic transglycosylase domain-containing protein n=1 Tax=Spirochaeta lutea TaxID=1480694 RepID=UPI00138E50C5|nr:lytic transglycosylase domain-containing protein [Spirochaeta lutea]
MKILVFGITFLLGILGYLGASPITFDTLFQPSLFNTSGYQPPEASRNFRLGRGQNVDGSSEITPSPLPDPWGRMHPPRSYFVDGIIPDIEAVYNGYQSAAQLSWFISVLTRGDTFRSFIMQEIEQRNLPSEIFFLAMVESEFLVRAESSSGARGLWQFMENSMAPWMYKNSQIDERFGLVQSTRAALNKLEENYRVLGDWLLAFAAYNQGLGAISRAVERTGIRDYWELREAGAISPQAARYVPKILSAYLLSQELGRLGYLRDWSPPFHWTQILVPGGTGIEFLSGTTGIPLSILKLGNAHLLEGVLPPGDFQPLTIPQRYVQPLVSMLSFHPGSKPSGTSYR